MSILLKNALTIFFNLWLDYVVRVWHFSSANKILIDLYSPVFEHKLVTAQWTINLCLSIVDDLQSPCDNVLQIQI